MAITKQTPKELTRLIKQGKREQALELLDEIKKGIMDHSILDKTSKPTSVYSDPNTTPLLFSNPQKSDQRKIRYLDLFSLLQFLLSNADYTDEAWSFILSLNPENLGPNFLNECMLLHIGTAKPPNEEFLIILYNEFIHQGGDVSSLLPHSYGSSFFDVCFSNKLDKLLGLIMTTESFQNKFMKTYFLQHLKNTSDFKRALELNIPLECDNLSNININNFNDEVLVEYFSTFPHLLDQYFESNNEVKSSWSGNIFEIASYNLKINFLNFLYKEKPQAKFSFDQKNINDMRTASILLEHNATITNIEDNVCCVELMLKKGMKLSNLNFPKLLNLAGAYQCSEITKLALTSNASLNVSTIKQLIEAFYKTSPAIMLQLSLYISKQKSPEYDNLLRKLLIINLTFPGKFTIITALFKYNAERLQQLASDKNMMKVVNLVNDPRIIAALVENKFTVPYEKIKDAYLLSCLQNNIETQTILATHLDPKDRENHWHFVAHHQEILISEDKHLKIYGRNNSQDAFKFYQQEMIDTMTLNLIKGTFKLLPDDFNTANWNTVPKDYLAPFDGVNELDYSYRNREMCYIEEKYQNSPNVFTLGAMRYWIAFEARSENAKEFGHYRKEEFQTGYSDRYKPYFDKFIAERYDQYKESNYLTNCSMKEYDDYAAPLCTIVGQIDGKPIELTGYGDTRVSETGYGWHHTKAENIPLILAHADKLLKNIAAMKIDNLNPNNVSELAKNIGEVYWWISHSCPFERGSATLAEVIGKSLFKLHGLHIDYKTMIDCEVLISPSVEDFSKRFLSLIEVTPLALTQMKTSQLDENITLLRNCP